MRVHVFVPKEEYKDLLKNTISFGTELIVGCCRKMFSSDLLDNIKRGDFNSLVEISVHKFLDRYEKLNKLFEICDSFKSETKIYFKVDFKNGKIIIKDDLIVYINLCDINFIQEIHNILKEFGWKYTIDLEDKDYDNNEFGYNYDNVSIIVLDKKYIKCFHNISDVVIDPTKYDTIEVKVKIIPKFSLSTSA